MADQRSWSIEYQVREDEESVFIPADLLPDAQPGDEVELKSPELPVTRRGRVAELEDDATRGEFVLVHLD
jgi:hypothetical protein